MKFTVVPIGQKLKPYCEIYPQTIVVHNSAFYGTDALCGVDNGQVIDV